MIFNEISKQETRSFLLDTYKDRFGKLPAEKQYWTLSAECVKGSSLIGGTELDQLLSSGAIRAGQFHGIDNNPAIIKANKKYRAANWYLGDFYQVIETEMRRGRFNPAIIHYDSMVGPKRAVPYLARLMRLLRQHNGSMMLVSKIALQWKWCIKNNMRTRNLNDIVGALMKDKDALDGWDSNAIYRPYTGLNKRFSQMGTLVLFKG